MTANETFKVKTADEREAEFNAYQKKLDDEYRAQAYELAKHIEAFMDENPDKIAWRVFLTPNLCNDHTCAHLETLYRDAGFSAKFTCRNVIEISRK